MVNEINHREPRVFSAAGVVEPLPLVFSTAGMHSSQAERRESDLEQLGPAINLYLKMLKYLGFLFCFFLLLSLPSLIIFKAGGIFDSHEVALARWIG